MRFRSLCLLNLVLTMSAGVIPSRAAQEVVIKVEGIVGPISPFIYGVNHVPADGSGITTWRMGGNRQSNYNWENNASNAGSDWKHFSDQWPCAELMKYPDCATPGVQFRTFIERNKAKGIQSVVTIPMLDYVTADKNGEVTEAEKAPSKRWARNLPRKKGGYAYPPDLKDGVVYQDEFVSYLIKTFGPADKGGARFYNLDNEPALWSHTHPRIHLEKPRYEEVMERTKSYATMVTEMDPTAEVMGPAAFGWQEFINLGDAPGHQEWNAKFGSFTDYYLDAMAEAERKAGRRLLHALDLHFYPEAQGGGKRITGDDTSSESVEARLQAPRSLWDDSYVENSWITQHSTAGKPIRFLRWMRETINRRYPGTKMAITEYSYGAAHHVSGGLALADVLGVYGREGVYLACLWADWKDYTASAFRLYRNYDGRGGAFGDTSLEVENPDVAGISAFASKDSEKKDRLWVVMINKDQKKSKEGNLVLKGSGKGSWISYGFDLNGPEVRPLGRGKILSEKVPYSLKPLSATMFEVSYETR